MSQALAAKPRLTALTSLSGFSIYMFMCVYFFFSIYFGWSILVIYLWENFYFLGVWFFDIEFLPKQELTSGFLICGRASFFPFHFTLGGQYWSIFSVVSTFLVFGFLILSFFQNRS